MSVVVGAVLGSFVAIGYHLLALSAAVVLRTVHVLTRPPD
jgi:hypothetical protein